MKNAALVVLGTREEFRLQSRFDLHAVAGMTEGGIDTLDYVDALPGLVRHHHPTIVPRGAPILINGWAVEAGSARGSREVVVVLDRSRPHAAQTGIARGDVMEKYGTEEFVGFRAIVETGDLLPGGHHVLVYARAADGRWYEAAQAAFVLYEPAQPESTRRPGAVRIKVDTIADLDGGMQTGQAAIPEGRSILVSGWAITLETRAAPGGVVIRDERGRRWSAPCAIARADAAAALGAANAQLGFELTLPGVFERGRHAFTLCGYDAGGHPCGDDVPLTIDVCGAVRRFPLLARIRPGTPDVAAVLCDEDDEADCRREVLREDRTVEIVHGAEFEVEGWALGANGAAASEVFFEISVPGVDVPPFRYDALTGFRRDDDRPDDLPPPPCDDAWFTARFKTRQLQPRTYELSVSVVEPGRRSLARKTLCGLAVAAREAAAHRT